FFSREKKFSRFPRIISPYREQSFMIKRMDRAGVILQRKENHLKNEKGFAKSKTLTTAPTGI
ncbi:MAG: hypothetical protein J6R00_04845, partial [Lentisphaeria bacterium]|nr:hypothetical protein [Lentisphaeria bacterium]